MPLDPRTVSNVRQGTALRDAAVDPLPKDFLGPTNAGLEGDAGNPHGPHVVNPELHGIEDNRTIVPGPVSGTAATQEAAEVAGLIEYHPTAADQTPEPDPEPAG